MTRIVREKTFKARVNLYSKEIEIECRGLWYPVRKYKYNSGAPKNKEIHKEVIENYLRLNGLDIRTASEYTIRWI